MTNGVARQNEGLRREKAERSRFVSFRYRRRSCRFLRRGFAQRLSENGAFKCEQMYLERQMLSEAMREMAARRHEFVAGLAYAAPGFRPASTSRKTFVARSILASLVLPVHAYTYACLVRVPGTHTHAYAYASQIHVSQD